MADFLQVSKNGVLVSVKVHPGARKTRLKGLVGDMVKVDVAAPPEAGAANKELVKFLARSLGMAKGRVSVIRGGTSRNKVVGISDATLEEVSTHFNRLLSKE